MLEFFRKHQRYFYLFTTIVIVISFSFFGTYGAMTPASRSHEQTAFIAIDGSSISRAEVEQLAQFIASDSEDKLLMGGAWGANFFNDGVLRLQFLTTGLARELILAHPEMIGDELTVRLNKEKRFTPYAHPQAKFLSVENAWSYFAPQIKEHYSALQAAANPLAGEALDARINLYLEGRKLPPHLLRQLLLYQERQYGWLGHDSALDSQDLALFGYHTLSDWLGGRFLHLAAEFIINSAKLAEQRGYTVTREEASASLWENAQKSFQENSRNPYVSVSSLEEYLREQLRRLNMDMNRAVKLWQQVLLFRRLFQDEGSSTFVDALLAKDLVRFGSEQIKAQSYRLAPPLHLKDFNDLQLFETYLDNISARTPQDKAALVLPTRFFSAEELVKKQPALVQKRFLVSMAHVDKKGLQTQVPVKESWAWELDDEHWKQLQKQFPEIGAQKGDDKAARLAILDQLPEVTRERVDAFARRAIVDTHPEWVDQALKQQPMQQKLISLRLTGGKSPLAGVEKREQLLKYLEQAALANEAQQPVDGDNNVASSALEHYSDDDFNYYHIELLDRSPTWEVLTFAEAKEYDALKEILEQQLESFYQRTKEAKEKQFRRPDGSFKALREVKEQVAEDLFAKVLGAIRQDQALVSAQKSAETASAITNDRAASLRLYPYVRALYQQLLNQSGPEKEALEATFVEKPQENNAIEKLAPRQPLESQWALVMTAWEMARSHPQPSKEVSGVDPHQAFSLAVEALSPLNDPPNGDLSFYRIVEKGTAEDLAAEVKLSSTAEQLLGNEAQRQLFKEVMAYLDEKKALSLDYLTKSPQAHSAEGQEE